MLCRGECVCCVEGCVACTLVGCVACMLVVCVLYQICSYGN